MMEPELRKIASSVSGSASRIAAARLLLDALHDDPRVRRKALKTVLDRTEGKPARVQRVTSLTVSDPAAMLEQARLEAQQAVVGHGCAAAGHDR